VSDKFKPIEHRLNTLDEHIGHSENYKSYRGCKARHDKLYAEYQATQKQTGWFAERKAQKSA
jgi:hypothetical protein